VRDKEQEEPTFGQLPMGPIVDHLGHLEEIADRIQDHEFEFPDYCYEDPFFSDPEYPVALRCKDNHTHGPLHVVLISSFDGISWLCWMIEAKSFDIMELQLDDLD